MGRVAGILMLGYRYNSTKVPVSLVRHGRDKIFPRLWEEVTTAVGS